jgi:hypothetical protein
MKDAAVENKCYAEMAEIAPFYDVVFSKKNRLESKERAVI